MQDLELRKVATDIGEDGMHKLSNSPWSRSKDGLIRFNKCAYVPNSQAIISEIMRINHDNPQGGHFRLQRTLEAVSRKYYWRGMRQDIKEYVDSCDRCQRIATHRHQPYGLLEPLPSNNNH